MIMDQNNSRILCQQNTKSKSDIMPHCHFYKWELIALTEFLTWLWVPHFLKDGQIEENLDTAKH